MTKINAFKFDCFVFFKFCLFLFFVHLAFNDSNSESAGDEVIVDPGVSKILAATDLR